MTTEAQIEAARRAIAALVWDDSEAHAQYYYEVCRTAEHHERMAATCNHCEFVRLTEIARAALEAAERVAWRPVSEAPKDGKDVLVTGWAYVDPAKGRYQDVALWYRGDWMSEECGQSIHPPTHFRPLPAPPEEGMPA